MFESSCSRSTRQNRYNSLLRPSTRGSYCRLPTRHELDKYLPPPTVSANRCRNHARINFNNVRMALTYTTIMVIGWWLLECKSNLNKCLDSENFNKIIIQQCLIGAGAYIYNSIFSFPRFEHEDTSCEYIRKTRATLILYKRQLVLNNPSTQLAKSIVSHIDLYTKHHYKCRLNCSGKKLSPSLSDLGHKFSIFIINFLEGLLANFLIRSTTLMAYDDISGKHANAFSTSWIWWAIIIPPAILFAVLKTYYETISQSKVNSQWYLNDDLRELCFIFQKKDPDGIQKITSALNSHPALFPAKDFSTLLDTYRDDENGELDYS